MKDVWGTDAPVSKPSPTPDDVPVLVDFGGFGFGADGMCHNISASDVEEAFYPTYAPEGFNGA